MKANISLVTLALAAALPLAALAAGQGYGSQAGMQGATPATPASPATPATPAEPPAAGMGSGAAAFHQLDKNHDGKLSKDEVQSMPDMQTRFSSLDTDRDGKISMAEWNKGKHEDKL